VVVGAGVRGGGVLVALFVVGEGGGVRADVVGAFGHGRSLWRCRGGKIMTL